VHIYLQQQKKYDGILIHCRKENQQLPVSEKDKWKYVKINGSMLTKVVRCIDKRNGVRQYLTGGHRTTIKEFTIRSEAIERNVIMSFSTKKIIEIMQYRVMSSANGSILPMHYGSHRCCTPIIHTPLLIQNSV
jgi:hypothetical protein